MLGSTLTNVVVFFPLVLVQGEAGQLFADMAIALSCSSLFSLFAALTLVPMLSGLFLKQSEAMQMLQDDSSLLTAKRSQSTLNGQRSKANFVSKIEYVVFYTSSIFRLLQGKLESFLASTVRWSLGRKRLGRRLFVLSIPIALLVTSIFLLPPADYLPEGNRNLVFWIAEPLPGTSVELAVVPGQGAELYQGLGVVLTGGLAFSTILTPTVVPALMGLLRDISGRKPPSPSSGQQLNESVVVSNNSKVGV